MKTQTTVTENPTLAQLARYKDSTPFSETLNNWVKEQFNKLEIQVVFVAAEPYETYEDMRHDIEVNNTMYVSLLHSSHTIFGNVLYNGMFRAVHDMQHYSLNKDFSPESEFYITYKMLWEYRLQGLSQFDIDLLTIEMNGQVCYFLDNNGGFPDNQRHFTINELIKLGYK